MQVMHSLYCGSRLFAGLMLWLFVSLVQAASLSVNPVIITLSASDSIAAMTLTNNGSDDVVMQASVNAWSIRDNEEHYAATTALIVSPPVFQVAPGKSQIVRIGLSDTAPKGVEQSFRVFLEQAPATPGDESAADAAARGPRGVQMMLRLGIPVFVKAAGVSTSKLVWQAKRLANGRLQITAENQGNAHTKISRLMLMDKDKVIATAEQLSYLLPGSRRHWVLDVPVGTAAPYRIKAEAKDGVLETTISHSAP